MPKSAEALAGFRLLIRDCLEHNVDGPALRDAARAACPGDYKQPRGSSSRGPSTGLTPDQRAWVEKHLWADKWKKLSKAEQQALVARAKEASASSARPKPKAKPPAAPKKSLKKVKKNLFGKFSRQHRWRRRAALESFLQRGRSAQETADDISAVLQRLTSKQPEVTDLLWRKLGEVLGKDMSTQLGFFRIRR